MGRSTGKGFVVGTAIGALLGVATGMLFAPKKGEELRKDVAKSLKDYQEKASDTVGEIAQKGKEVSAEVAKVVNPDSINELTKRVVTAVSEKIESVQETPETKQQIQPQTKKYFKGTK
ncbi:hypothetical protein CO180_02200 [candidate division WWE3 bacterium CG_4_9_14_3_um_filter_41_6]|uniref:YtxH domain-containing protein n=1 Tax=candidate division WWE3 bacterium CG_4_10_14_0_2_um_filter_41_14 TaxID=1975072 RepID=A0A2M7TJY2_UNCKA|nr:MAG: hypothetical protein COY32_02380 [candidate division WWE3 bacterium CG_4_10_14_0_2_um_filter_41_14]PJA38881.1 MAG: hypothetical protein CO180_02200 [candidate division WWE3 bacterium CG_4_9_14_3_um_filter_41_6]